MRDGIKQFSKFYVVGWLAFIFDYGMLMLLSQVFHVNPVIAVGVAYVTTQVFNYMAMMRFVFTRREDVSRLHEFAVFFLLAVVGLAINEVVMWLGVRLMGGSAQSLTVIKGVAQTFVMFWNYYSRKKWLDAGSQA